MSSAREEILARIRAANGSALTNGSTATNASAAMNSSTVANEGTVANESTVADAGYAGISRDYLRSHHDPASTDIVALFAERAADYRAVVERVPADGIPAAIARVIAAIPASPPAAVLVPDGLPAEWFASLPARASLVRDAPPLSPAELDRLDVVITGCAVAIAETGTVVLDHGPAQGRRALTLVPDVHVVVVRADQVAADLVEAMSRLDPARPLTFISGPSATSDIELIRVEGVHGPRTLYILIAG
jgi:L-lactate dehydrogenase complex protein LldG